MKIATNMFEIAKIKTFRILLALNKSLTSLLKPDVPYVAIKKNTIIKQKKRTYSNSGEEILKYPSTNPVKKKEMITAMTSSQSPKLDCSKPYIEILNTKIHTYHPRKF